MYTDQDDQLRQALGDFSKSTKTVFGDYAYATGFYESLIANAFRMLSEENKKYFLSVVQEAAENKKQRAAEILEQNKTLERV